MILNFSLDSLCRLLCKISLDDFLYDEVAMSSEYRMLMYEFIFGCFVLLGIENLLGLRLWTIGAFFMLLCDEPQTIGVREVLVRS